MEIRGSLTYDDLLLVPQYSDIESRSMVDLSVQLPKGFSTSNPIIPANMKTVTGLEMAVAVADMGGLAILHRFMSKLEQLDIAKQLHELTKTETPNYLSYVGFSVGVKKEDCAHIDNLVRISNAKILCIDIAHGDSKMCVDMCQYIHNKYPDVLLIAGNVATGGGAERLWQAGADIVKVGIGPGSLCTTRIETGNGVPQLTALTDVVEKREQLKASGDEFWAKHLPIIADGGIKNAGDCVKALCFAELVMAGNLFAGTDEAPGTTITINDVDYKQYVGSSTHKSSHVEGVEALVRTKGPVKKVMTSLLEGIRSGCSYQGALNLTKLKESREFVRITNSGLKESHPHDVKVVK